MSYRYKISECSNVIIPLSIKVSMLWLSYSCCKGLIYCCRATHSPNGSSFSWAVGKARLAFASGDFSSQVIAASAALFSSFNCLISSLRDSTVSSSTFISWRCSAKQQEGQKNGLLLDASIHSPDNVVVVSIFISNHNHFCVLCFRLAEACSTTALCYDVLKYWTQYAKDVRTYGRTTPSLCLGTPVPRQKLPWWWRCDHFCWSAHFDLHWQWSSQLSRNPHEDFDLTIAITITCFPFDSTVVGCMVIMWHANETKASQYMYGIVSLASTSLAWSRPTAPRLWPLQLVPRLYPP